MFRRTVLACLLVAPLAAQDLAGEWITTHEFSSSGYLLSADGRCAIFDAPGEPRSFGTYTAVDGALTLRFADGEVVYRYAFDGEHLLLTIGEDMFEVTTAYAKSADSSARIAELLRRPDPDAVAGLVHGRWDVKGDFATGSYVFLADGRYVELESGVVSRYGRYELGEDELVICRFDGEPMYSLGLAFFGEHLQLSFEGFDGTRTALLYVAHSTGATVEREYPTPAVEELAGLMAGFWETPKDSYTPRTLALHPDGHCVIEDETLTHYGLWKVEGNQLLVDDLTGWTHTYTLTFFGADLVVTSVLPDGSEVGHVFEPRPELAERLRVGLARAPASSYPGALLGRWKVDVDFLDKEWVFVDDLYYWVEGGGLASRGQLRIEGEEVEVWNRADGGVTYRVWKLGEDRLVMVSTDFTGQKSATTLWKTDATDEDVRAFSAEVEAHKVAVDAAWKARIRFGPRVDAGGFPGLDEIPADTRADIVFPDATVFVEMEGYSWQGSAYAVETGPRAGTVVFDRTDWYFLPNGRVYQQVTSQGTAGPVVQGVWGRYTVEGEQIRWAVADTEELLDLEDGRRNLYNAANLRFVNLKVE